MKGWICKKWWAWWLSIAVVTATMSTVESRLTTQLDSSSLDEEPEVEPAEQPRWLRNEQSLENVEDDNDNKCVVMKEVMEKWAAKRAADRKADLEAVEQEDDPYFDLPDDHQPDPCFMCDTNGQGPCGGLWRKYAQCGNDNRDNPLVELDCSRYFKAHSACAVPYSNLYKLIHSDFQQKSLERGEESLRSLKTSMPFPAVVDWKPLHEFFQEHGATFSEMIPDAIFPRDTPLWKKLPENVNPKLIELEIDVPRAACACVEELQEEIQHYDDPSAGGMALGDIYVVDQNDKIVGSQFYEPSQKKEEELTAELFSSFPDREYLQRRDGSVVKVPLYLLPGDTQSIQFKMFVKILRWDSDGNLVKGEAPSGCFCETEVQVLPVIE